MAAISITAASCLASSRATVRREYLRGSAGQSAGQLAYVNSSNVVVLVDSDSTPVGPNDIVGILLDGGGTGQPCSLCVADPDFTPGGTLSNGLAVYNFTTAGAITFADIPTTAAYPITVGLATSTTKMILKPVATGVVI